MTRWSSLVLLSVSALLLGACSSSPPVRYFGIQSLEAGYHRDPEGAPVLAIGPLRLPDYLKRSQMVTRGRGTELIVDDFNRWAGSLDEAIHRTIASNVDSLFDTAVVVAFPSSTVFEVNYRLIGRIDRFDVDTGGLAVLDVQWGIVDSSGNMLAAVRRTRYELQAEKSNDPAAMAKAMSEAIEQLSRDIAVEIEGLLH